MIDHSKCDHDRTRAGRAKCRRGGEDRSRREGASSKEVDFSGSGSGGGPTSQTPAWKADECHVCGVERIEFLGRDDYTNLIVLVGEKCAWRVKNSDEFRAFVRR